MILDLFKYFIVYLIFSFSLHGHAEDICSDIFKTQSTQEKLNALARMQIEIQDNPDINRSMIKNYQEKYNHMKANDENFKINYLAAYQQVMREQYSAYSVEAKELEENHKIVQAWTASLLNPKKIVDIKSSTVNRYKINYRLFPTDDYNFITAESGFYIFDKEWNYSRPFVTTSNLSLVYNIGDELRFFTERSEFQKYNLVKIGNSNNVDIIKPEFVSFNSTHVSAVIDSTHKMIFSTSIDRKIIHEYYYLNAFTLKGKKLFSSPIEKATLKHTVLLLKPSNNENAVYYILVDSTKSKKYFLVKYNYGSETKEIITTIVGSVIDYRFNQKENIFYLITQKNISQLKSYNVYRYDLNKQSMDIIGQNWESYQFTPYNHLIGIDTNKILEIYNLENSFKEELSDLKYVLTYALAKNEKFIAYICLHQGGGAILKVKNRETNTEYDVDFITMFEYSKSDLFFTPDSKYLILIDIRGIKVYDLFFSGQQNKVIR